MPKVSHVLYVATFVASVAGCVGRKDLPKLAPARGIVLYNDKPVSGATVVFQVPGQPLAMGMTDAEGKFEMKTLGYRGAPLGEAKVGISKSLYLSTGGRDPATATSKDLEEMEKSQSSKAVFGKPEIPVKYGHPDKSGLEARMTEDGEGHSFEFRLKDDESE